MEQVSMNTPLDSLSNAINDLEYHVKYSSYKIAPEMQERILKVGTKFREYVAVKQTSNSMIEGEEIAGWIWNKERILDLIGFIKDYGHAEALFQDYLKFCKKPDSTMPMIHSSQPIVKGEGKWSELKEFLSFLCANDFTDYRDDKEMNEIINEFKATKEPTPSPEKQEEGYIGNWDDVMTVAAGTPLAPKPDGMQGEKENTSWPFVNTSRWPDLSKLNLESHQTTPPTDSKDRTIGDILEKHIGLTKEWGNYDLIIDAMQEWGDQEVAKVKEEYEAQRKVSNKLYKNNEELGHNILELQSELQTLRDNNSKLVEACKNLLVAYGIEDFDFHHKNATGKSIIIPISEALQSITGQ